MNNLHWHIDMSFAIYPDIMIYIDTIFSLSYRDINSSLIKQKTSSRSLIETKPNNIDDKIIMVIHIKSFIE